MKVDAFVFSHVHHVEPAAVHALERALRLAYTRLRQDADVDVDGLVVPAAGVVVATLVAASTPMDGISAGGGRLVRCDERGDYWFLGVPIFFAGADPAAAPIAITRRRYQALTFGGGHAPGKKN